MSRSVGVVIPCKNERRTIERCLLSLRAQRLPPRRIVVVDNGSTDGSVQVAQRLADEVLHLPSGRIAHLRNQGALAVGDVDALAFVDADCEVAPDWLVQASAALEHAEVVGSRTRAPDEATWVSRRWAAVEAATTHDQSRVWSQAMVVDRSMFERLGGFDQRLTTNEDSDLSARAVAAGGRVRLVPAMVATHHGFAPTLRRFVRRERWHSSQAGWYGRMSRQSQVLVVFVAAWTVLGAVLATGAAARSRPGALAVWTGASVAAVPALGTVVHAAERSRWRDGFLVALWALVRASRLPREFALAAARREAKRSAA